MRGKLSRSIAINNVYHRRGRSTATWVFTSPPPTFFPHHFHLFSTRFFLTLHKICRMVAVYLSRQERDLKSSCRCIHRTWNAATSKRFCSSQSVRVRHPLTVLLFFWQACSIGKDRCAPSRGLVCYGTQAVPWHAMGSKECQVTWERQWNLGLAVPSNRSTAFAFWMTFKGCQSHQFFKRAHLPF